MKKFFAIAALATVMVSCGDEKKPADAATTVDTMTKAATEAAGNATEAATNMVDTAVKTATQALDTAAKK